MSTTNGTDPDKKGSGAEEYPGKLRGSSRPGEDAVLPFTVEHTGVRGRIVRLGPVVDAILSRHDYPEPVARLLGEALALTAVFGASLKFDGSLILQTVGNGPVGMMVASFKAPGSIRGYAKLDHERYAELINAKGPAVSQADLFGDGQMAITIDPGKDMHRYQGIVALNGESLAEAAHEYFMRSEQIATELSVAVGRSFVRGEEGTGRPAWRAGAAMIQHLAIEGGLDEDERRARAEAVSARGVLTEGGEPVYDAWERASALFKTIESHELIDPEVSSERLLYRLFHEDGVRVYEPSEVDVDCRCTRMRSLDILKRYGEGSFDDMLEDGQIKMTCEYCNYTFAFDPSELGS